MAQIPAPAITEQSFAVPLDTLSREEINVAGGKAANLGELLSAGLQVPPGFCVTTQAYAAATISAELDDILDRIARAMDQSPVQPTGGTESLSDLAALARESILRAHLPIDVESDIRDAYAELSSTSGQEDRPVAVRSSATAEDLPGASFAGQQDTYLNIIGSDEVVNAVRRCWASLWTDRAVAYRASNKIDPHAVQLAVVVQQQIQSAVAGVMFTANPVTGRRAHAVIDASPGLGEAVVSGAVTPDHFVVDTATSRTIERRLGDKRLRIESLPGGGTRRVDVSSSEPNEQSACVSEDQLRQLAALAQQVERHYGAPQDTEWAIDSKGKLWLLQSRPITTLYPLPDKPAADDGDLRVYFSFNVAQGVYQPITPMGLQAFKLLGSNVAQVLGWTIADPFVGPPAMAAAGHRLFLDITGLLRNPIGRELLPTLLQQGEARSVEVLETVLRDPRVGRARGSRLAAVRGLARLVMRSGVALGVARTMIDPDGSRRNSSKLVEALVRHADVPASATANQRLDVVTALPTRLAREMLPRLAPLIVTGLMSFAVAQRLLRNIATRDELDTVRRGLAHNPTTEMDLALWDLAQHVRSDPTARQTANGSKPDDLAADFAAGRLPSPLQKGLADFLAAYGHRGVAEIDLGVPHWADNPAHILGVLANYLALENPALSPDAKFRRVAAEADALVSVLADRAAHHGALRGLAVRFLLRRFRKLGGLREAPKFHLVRMLYAMRRLLAPIGLELANSGKLESSDDVYMLTIPELRAAIAGADVRSLVRQRREEMAFEAQRRRVPRILLSDGTDAEALVADTPKRAIDANQEMLDGSGASSGRVTGVARVILDPHGAKLAPGEILVAPSTDPGWTPLFLTAGGLVMEMGGPMSHGAIVAREYGIPAVVGVSNATQVISPGQTISVDGSAGTVTIEKSAA